ncbi:hypothetical protein ACFOWM_05155 [Ferruginibacter yonginensis]|uniref:Uncharacterized protein n=1 Tax=Ferruginibacter yonginensis TaxID=1310416 RepID=A0ABV8QR74_9BACT
MHNTKVMLSSGELALAADKNVILTKRKVIQTVEHLFAEQIPTIQLLFAPVFADFEPLLSATPKIFKGENYEGFPYVMLDYPAHFSKNNVAAVRTMFWWGHAFSITLHLKGDYKIAFEQNLIKNKLLGQNNVWVCINEKEWEHHFEPTNYIIASTINATQKVALQHQKFLKIAVQFPISTNKNISQLLEEAYQQMAELLKP